MYNKSYSGPVVLLVLNMLLQFFMSYKMYEITRHAQSAQVGELLGLCQPIRSNDMLWAVNRTMPPNQVYTDCGPLSVTIMSNLPWLDTNQDGLWTIDEATATMVETEARLPREADMRQLFENVETILEEQQPIQNWTGHRIIDMKWLSQLGPHFKLCSALDPLLCDNFETRGLLQKALPEVPYKEARIRKCETLLSMSSDGFCRQVFGERFRWYVAHRTNICGRPLYHWNHETRRSFISYETAKQWLGKPDSIISPTFAGFLTMMLLVWIMIMTAEFHEIFRWFFVLVLFETGETRVLYDEDGEHLTVKQMDLWHRNFVLAVVLLPRFVIFCLITYVGTTFLAGADSCLSLLLNATALAFVKEIDTMLYNACSDDVMRFDLARFRRMHVTTMNSFVVLHNRHFTLVYALVMVLAAGGFVALIYYKPLGQFLVAEGMECLCHATGAKCLSSVLLSM